MPDDHTTQHDEAPPAPTSSTISGPTRPRLRWFALLLATVLIVYLCWLMLAPFLDVLMWAVVLVVAFFPLHRRILKRVRSPGGSGPSPASSWS